MHVRSRFSPVAQTVGEARRFVGSTLAQWGMDEGDALLLTSELATNAVRHARTPYGIEVTALEETGFRVAVTDDDPRPPLSDILGSDHALGGRGMLLVVSLSRRWGCDQRADGKTVWFEL